MAKKWPERVVKWPTHRFFCFFMHKTIKWVWKKHLSTCPHLALLTIAFMSEQTPGTSNYILEIINNIIIAAIVGSNDNSISYFQCMVSTKSMEILVKSSHPYSHRHSLLVMGQIRFHHGVLLWNPEQQFTFDLGRFFLWNCLEIVCKVQIFSEGYKTLAHLQLTIWCY